MPSNQSRFSIRVPRLLVAALGALLLVAAGSTQAALKCTPGCDNPTVVDDVRAAIEAQCPCAQQASKKAYNKCAKPILKAEKSRLGKRCLKVVKGGLKNSTCGRPGTVPCNKRNKKDTKTKCKVVPSAKCKGSACGAFTSCLDACNSAAETCATTTTTTSTTSSTTTTPTTSTTTTTAPPPGCCDFTRLSFTTGMGVGNCGFVQNTAGTTILNIACGGLYFGSGLNSVPLPALVPDMGTSLSAITACNGQTGELTLASLTSAQTGSNRNCTDAGCLFGPPLPIPNSNSTPTSTCVINSVTSGLTGTGSCGTGESTIDLPLNSQIFLTGDILPGVTGIQPCPLCSAGTCQGGPNDGSPCTEGSSALNPSYPTSHDCPPDPSTDIGGLAIPFALTTGATSRTAGPSGTQLRVFCGFCRDQNFIGTLAFENPPRGCMSDADCTTAAYPDCEQRNNGAFGNATSKTITVTGSPAGDLTDGMAHDATLVGIFCTPPTYDPTVDNAGDLPGPGATALTGQAQLLP